jgi:hypothetical protein
MLDKVRRSYANTLYALEFNADPLRVNTSATQNISSGTNTKLVFGTIVYGTNWATNRYTVQTDGLYSVMAAIRTTGTNRSLRLMLYVNGVLNLWLCDNATTVHNTSTINGLTELYLTAGDYVEFWLYPSGGAVTIANGTDVQAYIRRVL